MSKARRGLYRAGSLLGDVEAAASGKPARILKRICNKWMGKNIIKKLWRR